MNNLLRTRTLTDRFFDGDTTPEEEQELYDFYRQNDVPEDLRPHQELFRDLAALAALKPAVERTAPKRRRQWWFAVAAIAVALIIGGTALYRFQLEDECVVYIYGQRVTDRDVVLGEMKKTMTVLTADGGDAVEEQLKAMFSN